MSKIRVLLWNHGTDTQPKKPCGEVDVFSVSGEGIQAGVMSTLVGDDKYCREKRFEWFGDLPTERAINAEAVISSEDNDFEVFVKSYTES